MKIKSGIYCIKNTLNGKVYIGSSVNVLGRINSHRCELDKCRHYNKHLQFAYNKYKEHIRFHRVETVAKNEDLLKREQYWIDFYKSYLPENGYNLCRYAGNTLGVRPTKEARAKMSAAQKGENNGMYGKTHTEEVRKRLSEFHTGIVMPPEFKEKMSKVTKGEKNGMYGKRHTPEMKKLMSIKLQERGGYKGENNPNFGNKWSEEGRQAMRDRIKSSGGYIGDRNPAVKIKSCHHLEILNRVKDKGLNEIPVLAKQFCVCELTIHNILKKVGYEKH